MSSHQDLITCLHEFCAEATAKREVSHGWQHMDCVRENSLKIWETEKIQYSGNPEVDVDYVTTLIIAVAQLHDVADHKYGKTAEQLESVRTELSRHFSPEDVSLIQDIIDNVSFSKEAKHRRIHGAPPIWAELGHVGRIVRNVCSDADKMEAIGLVGIERCLQYSAEVLGKKGRHCDITAEVLIAELITHGHEKLFILLDQYIITEGGKFLAQPRHDAMMLQVEKLERFLHSHLHRATAEQPGPAQNVGEVMQQELSCFEGGAILLEIIEENRTVTHE